MSNGEDEQYSSETSSESVDASQVTYCPSCGTSIDGGDSLCPSCGGTIEGTAPEKGRKFPFAVFPVLFLVALIMTFIVVYLTKPPGEKPSALSSSSFSSPAGSSPVISSPAISFPTISSSGTTSPETRTAFSIPAAGTTDADTYNGKVSGADGGDLSFGSLSLSFPRGTGNGDVQIDITRQRTLPPIKGTPEEIEAYKKLRVIGDIFYIKTSQTVLNKPFFLEMKFDPALVKGEDPVAYTVADGKLTVPEVIAGDLEDGYMIIRSEHCSYWFLSFPVIALAAYVGYQANNFARNEREPWNLIEPYHSRISDFIATNSLALPPVGPKTERFTMSNYNKKFQGRPDTYYNRVVHLIGNKGSDVLDLKETACWDMTTLFGSILYTMKPDMSQRIRLVKGSAGGTRHSWVEVVVEGQVFVVNTGRTDTFEFVARDVLYREQKLVPTHMYTKDPGSLRSYDLQWFKPFLYDSSDINAKIEALKAEHRLLQGELVRLGAQGTEITAEGGQQMDALRCRQKAIYTEVMELKKKQKK